MCTVHGCRVTWAFVCVREREREDALNVEEDYIIENVSFDLLCNGKRTGKK